MTNQISDSRLEQTLKFDFEGLIPVITQEVTSKIVLFLGYANKEAVLSTLQSREATYWSKSRKCIWEKGKFSSNYWKVNEVLVDSNRGSLIYMVENKGPTQSESTYDKLFNLQT